MEHKFTELYHCSADRQYSGRKIWHSWFRWPWETVVWCAGYNTVNISADNCWPETFIPTERCTHCYKAVSDIEDPPGLGHPRADLLCGKGIANIEVHYVRGVCSRIYIVHQSDMRCRNHHTPRGCTLPIHGIHQSLLRLCHSERINWYTWITANFGIDIENSHKIF